MDEVRLVPINITNGEITGISIDCEGNIPEVKANISLIDDYGKSITTISIGTQSWNSISGLKVSTRVYALIGELIGELKVCAI